MSDSLIALFARVLKVSPDDLSDESNPDTVTQWDSLKAMQLVAEIEETFNVHLSTTEIMIMDSIERAREVLKSKGISGL